MLKQTEPRRSKFRTKWPQESPRTCAVRPFHRYEDASNSGSSARDRGRERSQQTHFPAPTAVLRLAKHFSWYELRANHAGALGLLPVGLVERLASGLPHFSSPQWLLAERMFLIVTDFRTEVVKFIFAGRNSGQGKLELDTFSFSVVVWSDQTRSAFSDCEHDRQLLRWGSWVTTFSETARMQDCPSNRIRLAE